MISDGGSEDAEIRTASLHTGRLRFSVSHSNPLSLYVYEKPRLGLLIHQKKIAIA